MHNDVSSTFFVVSIFTLMVIILSQPVLLGIVSFIVTLLSVSNRPLGLLYVWHTEVSIRLFVFSTFTFKTRKLSHKADD